MSTGTRKEAATLRQGVADVLKDPRVRREADKAACEPRVQRKVQAWAYLSRPLKSERSEDPGVVWEVGSGPVEEVERDRRGA